MPLAFALLLVVPGTASASNRAYVVTTAGVVVTIDTSAGAAVGTPIGVAANPRTFAVNAAGTRAYVGTQTSGNVSVVDLLAGSAVGLPVAPPGGLGYAFDGIAVNPDGSRVYASAIKGATEDVSILDTLNSVFLGTTIPVSDVRGIAMLPDGSRAYAGSGVGNSVVAINTATNTASGAPIALGAGSIPNSLAVTPDGRRLLVADTANDRVLVYDTATNGLAYPAIAVGDNPRSIAVSPDGRRAYVANQLSNNVSVIDVANGATVGGAIPVGGNPTSIAASPDGSLAYVNSSSNNVTAISTASAAVTGTIPVGSPANDIVFAPNQAPAALFSAGAGEVGRAVAFDAGASSDPDGSVASYAWDFGDGATGTGVSPQHTYAQVGTYTVRLTVADDQGCSTQLIYTGQTASCNGKASASLALPIAVGPDKTAPKIELKAKRKYKPGKVKITFSADESAAFKCKLDKAKAKGCRSPVAYRKLKSGKHTVKITATDSAGNSRSAKAKFKVSG